ncbi:MAG: hypothetical protein DRR16_32140 [Candidatus Parabeggiatoa sp. nov. 3]|nr:MAG: hypothetical protein DRR00_18010 [Gammaproteobacteria bacterium]RKZ64935.1 MAG: hypothetical protein DRQ99_14190 [Gammaproteobacteria bacterium]RKZ74427.1 MAG: hypothetical protein DRR16_32140 [Gammaproteobacteria bacterium]
MSKIKTVFIVGNKLSGSTQLMKLMNLHPNIFISNESDILWILYRFHNDLDIVPYQWDAPKGMNATLEQYRDLLSKDKTPLENFITLQTKIMQNGFITTKPMPKEYLLWIGDQKPFQQIDPEIVPFIKAHFPCTRFVHLVRHPFPVVRSAKLFPTDDLVWKTMPEEEILKLWTMHESWVNIEKEKRELPMIDIKYEDLITNTQREMARLFDFLKLGYDKAILTEARKITRSTIKLHTSLPCPIETEAVMFQYDYKTKNFWLEQPFYIDFYNLFLRLKRKVMGTW